MMRTGSGAPGGVAGEAAHRAGLCGTALERHAEEGVTPFKACGVEGAGIYCAGHTVSEARLDACVTGVGGRQHCSVGREFKSMFRVVN